MVTLDYETPNKPKQVDLWGRLSLWLVVGSMGMWIMGGAVESASSAALFLILCFAIAGIVCAYWSLMESGVSWRVFVGGYGNFIVLVLAVLMLII
jgi:hypothetical protein